MLSFIAWISLLIFAGTFFYVLLTHESITDSTHNKAAEQLSRDRHKWEKISMNKGYYMKDHIRMPMNVFTRDEKTYILKSYYALLVLRSMMHGKNFEKLLKKYNDIPQSLRSNYSITELDNHFYINVENEKVFWLQTQYGKKIGKYLNTWLTEKQLIQFGKKVL